MPTCLNTDSEFQWITVFGNAGTHNEGKSPYHTFQSETRTGWKIVQGSHFEKWPSGTVILTDQLFTEGRRKPQTVIHEVLKQTVAVYAI